MIQTPLYSDKVYMSAIAMGLAHGYPDLVEVGLSKIVNKALLNYSMPILLTEFTSTRFDSYSDYDIDYVLNHEKNMDAVGLACLALNGVEPITLLDIRQPISRYHLFLYSAVAELENKSEYSKSEPLQVITNNTRFEQPPWWIFIPGTSLGRAVIKRYHNEFGLEENKIIVLFDVFQKYPTTGRLGYLNRYSEFVLDAVFSTDPAWCANLWDEYVKPKYKEYVEDIINEL